MLLSHIHKNNLVINIVAESTNYSEIIENSLVGTPARLSPGSALLLMDKDYINVPLLSSTQLLAIKNHFQKIIQ